MDIVDLKKKISIAIGEQRAKTPQCLYDAICEILAKQEQPKEAVDTTVAIPLRPLSPEEIEQTKAWAEKTTGQKFVEGGASMVGFKEAIVESSLLKSLQDASEGYTTPEEVEKWVLERFILKPTLELKSLNIEAIINQLYSTVMVSNNPYEDADTVRSILKEYGTAPVSRNDVLDEAIEAIKKERDENDPQYLDEAYKIIEKLKSKTIER